MKQFINVILELTEATKYDRYVQIRKTNRFDTFASANAATIYLRLLPASRFYHLPSLSITFSRSPE